jgi:hypothetical protein
MRVDTHVRTLASLTKHKQPERETTTSNPRSASACRLIRTQNQSTLPCASARRCLWDPDRRRMLAGGISLKSPRHRRQEHLACHANAYRDPDAFPARKTDLQQLNWRASAVIGQLLELPEPPSA